MVRLIGIVGRAGSGKSTLASSLCALLPRAVPLSLATPFKLSGAAHDDLPLAEVFGPDAKSDVTRQALQRAGTEHGRDTYGPDIWLKHADADIYRLGRYGTQHIVCDDVRFDNEAAWVRANGGALIKLVGRQTLMAGDAANHPSETAIDGIAGDLTLNTMALDPNTAATLAYGFLLGFSRPGDKTPPGDSAQIEGGE